MQHSTAQTSLFGPKSGLSAAQPGFRSAPTTRVAHPGVGGPRLENTTPVAAGQQVVAATIDPAENIGCDFSDQHSYVGFWIDGHVTGMPSRSRGTEMVGWRCTRAILPAWRSPRSSKNKAPAFQRPETPPQVMPYGTVVYHGDYTCASELAGMTCWNTITGHGAFMSSTNTTAFQEACSQTTLRPVKSVVKPYATLDGGCEQAPGCDVQVRRSGWCDESVLGVDRERPPSRSGAELSKEPAPRREIFRWPTLPMPTLCPHPELARLIVDDN